MFNIFKRKKYTITLKEFNEAVAKIAKARGRKYYTVSVECTTHSFGKTQRKMELKGYIDGYGHKTGLTIKEVCDQFEHTNPKESPITDVKI